MLNKAILMGRLTKDVELRHTESGVPVASFTLAVDRGFKKEGQQNVDFLNVVAWRNTAEFVSKWFSKGQLVAVTGRLQSRSFKDKDGNNRTVTEVVADEVFFAESKKNDSAPTKAPKEDVKEEVAEGTYDTTSEGDFAGFEELTMDEPLPWEL